MRRTEQVGLAPRRRPSHFVLWWICPSWVMSWNHRASNVHSINQFLIPLPVSSKRRSTARRCLVSKLGKVCYTHVSLSSISAYYIMHSVMICQLENQNDVGLDCSKARSRSHSTELRSLWSSLPEERFHGPIPCLSPRQSLIDDHW